MRPHRRLTPAEFRARVTARIERGDGWCHRCGRAITPDSGWLLPPHPADPTLLAPPIHEESVRERRVSRAGGPRDS